MQGTTAARTRHANHILTSESVTEGHPDKVCDLISDTILDECLRHDRAAHVACEALAKGNTVVVAGEISAKVTLDFDALVARALTSIGYTDPVKVVSLVSAQAPEINDAVRHGHDDKDAGGGTAVAVDQGAGDQGVMFGYATRETEELMPLPVLLAHNLARQMADDRKSGSVGWLRPDGKTQVSVLYEGDQPVRVETVLVSTQHAPEMTRQQPAIAEYVRKDLAVRALGRWYRPEIEWLVNPSGSFELGGPTADCGLTGRKIIVDTYGGAARHGGGAFSGKDPSKVDRSGAYFCRWVARQIVERGYADRAEVQVAYAIGRAKPVSIMVETFGTGDPREAAEFAGKFDYRPAAIIEKLDLLRPIYHRTTNYGHFGKPDLPWEQKGAVGR